MRGWRIFGRKIGVGRCLYDAFPTLFSIAAHNEAMIKDLWSPDEGGREVLRRKLNKS